MDPANIQYTQIGISTTFGRPDINRGRNIGETLDDLCDGVCTVGDIDPIRVFPHEGRWWSMDNRRLWVFKQFRAMGRCSEIPVKITTREKMDDDKFDANTGTDVCVRGPVGGRWYGKAQAERRQAVQKAVETKVRKRESQPTVRQRFTAPVGSTGCPNVNLHVGDVKRGGCDHSGTREAEGVPVSDNKSPFWSGILLGFLSACVLFWIWYLMFFRNLRCY